MKKVKSFLLVFFLSITSIIGQVNLKNGLVACYPFNANAKDESGNGNNGTVNSATLTTDRFGKANSAYNFDGSTQFIEVSANQFQNNNYSFSIWANPDVTPPTNTYFYPFSVGGSGGDQSIDLSNSANGATGWTFGGYSLGGGRVPFCDQAFLPTPAKWYHIVGIRNNNKMTLYVNGQLVKTDDTGGLLPSYGTNTKVTIGCRSALVQYFQGKVDDLHIYNRPITADEVKALFESSNTNPTITISTSNSTPCGGDKITFTANGAITSAKYQWKVDGINQGTNSKNFDYTSVKKTGDYTVKVTVEVTDNDPCFPQKPATNDQTITIKDCAVTPMGVNLKNGLVACYPFSGNGKDETGNGNNGTVNGATLTADRFGKENSAYNFNGSSLIAVNPTQFQNPSYTYATWVKLDNLPSAGDNNCFITIGGAGGDQVLSVTSSYQTQTSNGFNVGGYNNGSPIQSNNWNNITPTIGKWYHIVCTRDNTSIKLYVDGQLIANNSILTNTGGTTPNYGSPTYVTFGSRNGGASQYMQGSLDDIHLYNRPLNAQEVKALYDENTPQTITVTASNSAPCGGDKITLTANGSTNTSKFQWKVDGVNQGTNSKIFNYTSVKKTSNYSVKITVEVTDEDPCFPQKPVTTDQTITIKDCAIIPTGVNLKNGLVACYPFNANAKDESGNNNNGTVNSANLTADRFGKANSAYSFNGSNFIALPTDKFALNEFSYAVWIYIASNPVYGDAYRILSIGGNCGDQDINTGNNYFAGGGGISGIGGGGYNISSPISNSGVVAGTLPTIGQWYHGVITRDKNEIKLYVNGFLVRTVSTNGTLPYYGCDGKVFANIGTRSTQTQFFIGNIDDVHIYNRAINADEVKALYDGNSAQTITITASNSAPCGGDKIIFTANGATNSSKYQWKVDGVNQGANSKTFDYTSVKNTVDYSVKITVEVTDDDLCFPQKPVTVDKNLTVKFCSTTVPTVGNKILIPNAFSPNGDSMNDTWDIFSTAGITGNPDIIVEIYDRWGELIFYSKGYSEPWNGTYKDKPVLEGSYAYIIKVDAETVLRGAVLVVR